MKFNLLWTGREYYSLENCLVSINPDGANVVSTIIGLYKGILYKVEYSIKTNKYWETVLLEIHSHHNDKVNRVCLESNGKGSWLSNSIKEPLFDDCLDVDIPLTPFTNTLPSDGLN